MIYLPMIKPAGFPSVSGTTGTEPEPTPPSIDLSPKAEVTQLSINFPGRTYPCAVGSMIRIGNLVTLNLQLLGDSIGRADYIELGKYGIPAPASSQYKKLTGGDDDYDILAFRGSLPSDDDLFGWGGTVNNLQVYCRCFFLVNHNDFNMPREEALLWITTPRSHNKTEVSLTYVTDEE